MLPAAVLRAFAFLYARPFVLGVRLLAVLLSSMNS